MKPPGMVLVIYSLFMGSSAHCVTAEHPFRLPALPDRLPPVIWSSTCQASDGMVLTVLSEDTDSIDG